MPAGSLVHAQTGSLKRAQQLLRHSRIETTADTYVHVGDEASRDSARLLSEALESCPPICPPTAPESSYVN